MRIERIAETTSRILDYHVFGNPVREYAECLAGILVGFLIVNVFKRFIINRLRKWSASTATSWDDLLVATLEDNAIPALYVLILYLGLRDLTMKSYLGTALRTGTTIAITVLAIRVAMAVVNHGIKNYWVSHGQSTATAEKNLNGIITMAKIVVWILGFILLLDNLGIKVSAFVAGLGITGIAVALAAQTILGDLFSYFVIFFDQPFEVGHAIKVGDFSGEVEHIGIKTTRLRSIDGEQIIVSNKFLTDSRVQNFRRMFRRRAVFAFEVDYATATEALRGIPDTVKALLKGFPEVTLDRVHFKDFAAYGLRFEAVYFVETPDYGRYMDIQQEVNLGIHERFAASGIGFAVPVRLAPSAQKVPGEQPVPEVPKQASSGPPSG
jgi:small-conductance mechanosensitive channel